MERFNNVASFLWAMGCLAIMTLITFALWNVDMLWGVASAVVCLGLIWHWWQDGGIHQGDEIDDTSLPYDEKVKTRF